MTVRNGGGISDLVIAASTVVDRFRPRLRAVFNDL